MIQELDNGITLNDIKNTSFDKTSFYRVRHSSYYLLLD